ncbi:hypothetical protein HDU96_005598 [Phlyctochytrium bullatum]|nr:hypothetical protein HDU96_005598 [Phlyctochytrium bullatum]
MSAADRNTNVDLENGTVSRSRYPPSRQKAISASKLLVQIPLKYANAPNYFSDKLPHELDGRISPEEYSRRIAILNQELAGQSLKDGKIVSYFWMIFGSLLFLTAAVVACIVFAAVKSEFTKRIALAIGGLAGLGLSAVGTAPFITPMGRYFEVTLPLSISPNTREPNPNESSPPQPDGIVEDLTKGWTDLDAERRLLWISHRKKLPHPTRKSAPWTIDVHEIALPPAFDAMGDTLPTYATAARTAPTPGTATQPNAEASL